MKLSNSPISALIIAYRRSEQVLRIIEVLSKAGISKIYIALDSVGDENALAKAESESLLQSILEMQKNSPLEINIAKHSKNVGCSAAVLSACNWFFSNEEYGIILEDDCIPSVDFVTFALSVRTMIDKQPNLWMACGTQFAPSSLMDDAWVTSRYALIWGWATSRNKWRLIVDSILNPQAICASSLVDASERQYWNAGSRRSSLGIVDAWDNVLIAQMIAQGAEAILPKASLVSNVGFDSAATHTKNHSRWLSHEPTSFKVPQYAPTVNLNVDFWLKKHFYGIAFRHRFSTRITQFLDFVSGKHARAISLKERSDRAAENFNYF
jgi:hypothetical protein